MDEFDTLVNHPDTIRIVRQTAWKLAKRFGWVKECDFESLVQVGTISSCYAARRYDPEKSVWTKYCYHQVWCHLWHYIDHQRKKPKGVQPVQIGGDPCNLEEHVDPYTDDPTDFDTPDSVKSLLSRLGIPSYPARLLAMRYVEHRSWQDIAKSVGVTYGAVHQQVHQAIRTVVNNDRLREMWRNGELT